MNIGGANTFWGGIGEAFGDRNFRVYTAGSVASWTSYFVQLVAVSWLTWTLTESTVWLAIMALVDIVASVVLLPFTGAFADRFDRHRIMIWVCSLSLVQSGALAACSWFGVLDLVVLLVLEFIHAVLIAFMVPAMYGTLPRFIGKSILPSAIAVSSSYVQIAIFAGPAFAGWLISQHGVTAAFVVNAMGYAMLTLAFLALRTPEGYRQPETESLSVLRDIGDGIRYLIRDRRILTLLVLGVLANVITTGTYHMMPAYSERILNMGVIGMTLILSATGLGATIAALWIARVGESFTTDNKIIGSTLATVVFAAAIIGISNLYLAIAVGVLYGAAAEIRKTGTMTTIQIQVDERQRGRVMATWFQFSKVAGGIGTFVIGTAAVKLGLLIPTLACAAVCVAIWTVIVANRGKLL